MKKVFFFLMLQILCVYQMVNAQTVFKPTTLIIGKGTDVDMGYFVDRAGVVDPFLKWEVATGKWCFSNDSVVCEEMVTKTYVDDAVAGATISDATTTTKGKIQLAGDLSGTADAPTVPGLLLKADQTDLDALDLRVDTTETDIAALDLRVDEAESDISDLVIVDAGLDARIDAEELISADHETRLDVIEGDYSTQTELDDHIADTTPHATVDSAAITNPSRLDVKIDTLANLMTYALTASNGQLAFASDEKLMYQVVDGELVPVGSGLAPWEALKDYKFQDVVHESDRIYIATEDHTASATFSTDLSAGKWFRLNDEFNVQAQNDILIPIRTLEAPNHQITKTASDKALFETGNKNKLSNPGFEHETALTDWSVEVTGTALVTMGVDITTPLEGKKSATMSCTGSVSGGTCLIYQDALTLHPFRGTATIQIKSNSGTGVKVYSRIDGVNDLYENVLGIFPNTIEVPLYMGATSSGVAVEVTVNAAETIDITIDEGFVGVSDYNGYETELGTDWTPCEFSSLAWQGLGTVTQSLVCKRQGDDLLMHGVVTSGTVTSSEVILPLPLWEGVQLETASTSKIPSSIILGNITRRTTATSDNFFVSAEPSLPNLFISRMSTASGFDERQIGNQFVVTGESFSFYVRVPIDGWKTSTAYYESPNDPNDVGAYLQSINPTAPKGFISTTNKTIGLTAADYSGSDYYRLYEMIWNLPGISTVAGDPFYIPAKGASAKVDWDAGVLITVDFVTNEVYVRTAGATAIAGSYQGDAIRNITGYFGMTDDNSTDMRVRVKEVSGAFYSQNITENYLNSNSVPGNTTVAGRVLFDASRQVPVANEIRPKSTPMYSYLRYEPTRINAYIKQFDYVFIRATLVGSQSIPNSALTTLIYDSESDDTHNMFDHTTGVFSPTIAGLYEICPGITFATIAWTADRVINNRIIKNGSEELQLVGQEIVETATSKPVSISDCGTVKAEVGDNFRVHIFQNSSSSKSLSGEVGNFITITRIPGQFK